MTPSQDVDTVNVPNIDTEGYGNSDTDPLDELPGEIEMSLFDHLEELRQRIFYSLIAVSVGIIGCFFAVKPIVQLLVLPGLTRRERRLLGPVVLGSSVLFAGGLVFAYLLLIPAALKFFISYGADVVEQLWSIDKYFEFVLLLLFSTGLAFQIPIIQLLLGNLNIVSSERMVSGWRYVIMGAVVLGAVLTPSTDPLTQSLLAGAVLALYFGGVGLVKLTGK